MSFISDVYNRSLADTLRARVIRLERGRQYSAKGELVAASGNYAAVPEGLVDANGISLSNSGVQPVGSLAPSVVVPGFAYTSTDTSIHWYWDGTNGSTRIVIKRADGTQVPIPGGDINVTGLSASTKYYFLPFWDATANSCTIGWVGGTVGTPQIAFTSATDTDALQQQNLQTREQLWGGYMNASTASGGSTGGGGGGGRGCVMHGSTEVEPFDPEGAYNELLPETQWVRLTLPNGYSLNCTHDHPVYSETRGRIQAIDAQIGESMITKWGFMPLHMKDTFVRQCLKERWHVPNGHAMWCNGFLCHNQKAAPE